MRLYDIIGMEVTNTPRGGENMEENEVEVLREDEKVWEVPDLSKVAYNFNCRRYAQSSYSSSKRYDWNNKGVH